MLRPIAKGASHVSARRKKPPPATSSDEDTSFSPSAKRSQGLVDQVLDYDVYLSLSSPRERAEYASQIIGLPERKIPRNSPSICPRSEGEWPGCTPKAEAGVINSLSPIQGILPKLFGPQGLKRGVVCLPPGGGKTIGGLAIIASFLKEVQGDKGGVGGRRASDLYTIFLVADRAALPSWAKDLRRSPVRTPQGQLLRDFNRGVAKAGNSNEGFCALRGQNYTRQLVHREFPLPDECAARTAARHPANIFWVNIGKLSKILQSMVDAEASGAVEYAKKSYLKHIENVVIVIDEFHKIQDPMAAEPAWRKEVVRVARLLPRLPERGGPTIIGLTATPGDVLLAARLMGRRGLSANPVTLHRLLDARAGLTKRLSEVKLVAPWASSGSPVDMGELRAFLENRRALSESSDAFNLHILLEEDEEGARLAAEAVKRKSSNCYKLTAAGAFLLSRYLSGLFFIVDNRRDSRLYGEIRVRVCECLPTSDLARADYEEYWRLASASLKRYSWPQVSNFASPPLLVAYVRRRLSGEPHTESDEVTFRRNAPKWVAIKQNMMSGMDYSGRQLFGKTLVYLGVTSSSGMPSFYFDLGFAFYLGARSAWRPGFTDGLREVSFDASGKGTRLRFKAVYADKRVVTCDNDKYCEQPAVYVMLNSGERVGDMDQSLRRQVQLMQDKEYVERQRETYNRSPPAQRRIAPAAFSCCVMGSQYGAAADMNGNTLILTSTHDDVAQVQVEGRIARGCSMDIQARSLWEATIVKYMYRTPNPLPKGLNCDYALQSYYCGVGRLDRDIMSVTKSVSLGCGALYDYSQSELELPPPRCGTDEGVKIAGCAFEAFGARQRLGSVAMGRSAESLGLSGRPQVYEYTYWCAERRNDGSYVIVKSHVGNPLLPSVIDDVKRMDPRAIVHVEYHGMQNKRVASVARAG